VGWSRAAYAASGAHTTSCDFLAVSTGALDVLLGTLEMLVFNYLFFYDVSQRSRIAQRLSSWSCLGRTKVSSRFNLGLVSAVKANFSVSSRSWELTFRAHPWPELKVVSTSQSKVTINFKNDNVDIWTVRSFYGSVS